MLKIILFTLCLLSGYIDSAFSANHYICSVATGSDDGSDWTNAFPTVPSDLTRGDTYYIAGGTYPAFTLNAVSGTDYITVKKATASAHGTETGWQASYGTDQAVFSPIVNILCNYLIFDGVTGSADNDSTYGFKIISTVSDCTGGIKLISFQVTPVSYIQISHVYFKNCGSSQDYGQNGIYNAPATATTNMTISNNYFLDSTVHVLIRNWNNCVFENNFFGANWSSASQHGEQISPGVSCNDIIFRNNIFKDAVGYTIGMHADDNNRWQVYNNLVINGDFVAVFGSADSGTTDVWKNSSLHHNTIINATIGGYGVFFVGNSTNPTGFKSSAYNNLFYGCSAPGFANGGFTGVVDHGYSLHYLSTGSFDDDEAGTVQLIETDPLTDAAGGNYNLKAHTTAGKTDLGSPYNIDYAGNSRIVWDRGAYEYQVPYAYGSGKRVGGTFTGGTHR